MQPVLIPLAANLGALPGEKFMFVEWPLDEIVNTQLQGLDEKVLVV